MSTLFMSIGISGTLLLTYIVFAELYLLSELNKLFSIQFNIYIYIYVYIRDDK